MKTRLLFLIACVPVLALSAGAAFGADFDWPQFRGPNRDGVSLETGLLKTWPDGGPKLLWTWKNAGTGYAGPAVVGDRLYLSGARGDDELVYALDLTQNPPKQLWEAKIGPKFTWKGNTWTDGPLSNPTVAAGLVFALGAGGDLVCVDALAGREKWRVSLLKDLGGDVFNFQGSAPEKTGWGFACAPLVDSDKVICVPGGSQGTLAALDKATGKTLWRSKGLTDQATYASPVLATIAGTRQYLQTTTEGVAGVDPDGNLLWYYKRDKPYADILGASPLVKGDQVFISGGGEGGGSVLIEVAKADGKFTARKVYATRELANFHGGLVLVGDHVYGSSGDFGPTRWVCLDFKTGKVAWSVENRKLGKGAVSAADGFLYCLGESSDLVVHTPASPEQKLTVAESFTLPETSSKRKPSGKAWTHPVIANGKLYLRDQELLFCYDVK
jgi:outer membrane protein assembly factor BamB